MSMQTVFKGIAGLEIEVETSYLVADDDVKSVRYMKPDGTKGTWSASKKGTTQLSIVTAISSFDQLGQWYLQALLVNGTGKVMPGLIVPIYCVEPIVPVTP